jgi:cobalt/nickel transport system permease protein
LSLLAGASLAIAQLLLSGIRMPGAVLGLSLGLFAVSGILEGAITVAVVQALETLNPHFVKRPSSRRGPLVALGTAAVLLAVVGVWFASAYPDGLEKLAQSIGIAEHSRNLVPAPFADYEAGFFASAWLRKAVPGLAGLALIFIACLAVGRTFARRRVATGRKA